ncbi:hypothetical protein AAG906_040078 [Vitis piasezkii]
MLEVAPLLLPPHRGLHRLYHLHPSLLLHQSLGSPYPFRVRGLCHTLQTLTASRASRPGDGGHTCPSGSDYRHPDPGPPLAEQTMPPKETTTGEIEPSIPSIPTSTTEPSSPHDPPTTI